MLTTEAYSEAEILTKLSKEQAEFFNSLESEAVQKSYVTDAMEKLSNFAAFFDERSKLAKGYFQLKLSTFSLYGLTDRN